MFKELKENMVIMNNRQGLSTTEKWEEPNGNFRAEKYNLNDRFNETFTRQT